MESRPLVENNRQQFESGANSPQFKSFNSTKRVGSRVEQREVDVVKMNSRRRDLASSRNFDQLTE